MKPGWDVMFHRRGRYPSSPELRSTRTSAAKFITFLTGKRPWGEHLIAHSTVAWFVERAMSDTQTMPVRASTGTPLQSRTRFSHHILVVDDNARIRRLSAEALVGSGYNVDAAEDGAAAWEALQIRTYNLMITDQNMPKVSGVELLKKVHAAQMDLRVIMATGTPPTEEFIQYPWLQPTATLLKPYTVEELLGTVHEVLNVADSDRGQIEPASDWRSQASAGGWRV
jgi:two-component system chemotaxis response regulator CheY